MSPTVLLVVAQLAQGQGQIFDFRIQAQMLGLVSLPNVDGSFGGIEAQVNASVYSLGVAAGLAYEQLGRNGRTTHGGAVDLALQWRFVAMLDRHVFEWFDPHIDLGGLLGGLRDGSDSRFRGAFYVGGGLDFALWPDEKHPVLTGQYRFQPATTPGDVPMHFLMVGLGFRVAG